MWFTYNSTIELHVWEEVRIFCSERGIQKQSVKRGYIHTNEPVDIEAEMVS